MIANLAREQQAFTSNVFLVTGEGGRTVLVDVGNEFDVVTPIRERVDDLDAVVLTHTHPDHIGNLDAVTSAFDVDVWGYDTGFAGVDHALADGDTITLGSHEYVALHTPGHKDDHLCLYSDSAGVVFAGDLVFANGSLWGEQQNTVKNTAPQLNHEQRRHRRRRSVEAGERSSQATPV